MGQFLSKTPEPVHRTIATRAGYEIRHYDQYLIAEVDSTSGDGPAFRTLAKYIGAFGKAHNKAASKGSAESIAMTAPVVMPAGPTAVAMTAPVVSSQHVMQFVMPAKYKSVSDLPVPDGVEGVNLKEVPEKRVGVIRYSGYANNDNVQAKLAELTSLLKKDQLLPESTEKVPDTDWVFCGYDPPFTLGPFRRNEVWVDLHMTEEEVKSRLESGASSSTGTAAGGSTTATS